MKILKKLIKKDKELLKELFHSIDNSFGRQRITHFRYARPTKSGWSFFRNKQISWNLLEDITHRAAKKHIHCHRAVIADALSRLVNLSEKEFFQIRTAVL